MRKQGGSESGRSVLDPTLPVDLGARAQRQRVIDALIDCVAEKTYAATTIADIVSRASISRTTFYKHFADKRACFDAAVLFCIEALRDNAAATLDKADPPPLAVSKATAATLEFLAAQPAMAQLVMGEAVTIEPTAFGRYRNHLLPEVRALWDARGEQPAPHSDPQLALGRAQVLIFDKIAAGEAASLPELLPEIVYLVLLPFAGHDVALEHSRRAGGAGVPRPGSAVR